MNLFTTIGKLKHENASKFFGFGSSFYRNARKQNDKKKMQLVEIGANLYQSGNESVIVSGVVLIDVSFSKEQAIITYSKKGVLHQEKVFFDNNTSEFYTTPVHIPSENRFDDFRSSSAIGLLAKKDYI